MSIDQIIEKAKDYYSHLNTSEESKKTYARFLEEIRNPTKADIIYHADRLILYSILTRQTPIQTQTGQKTIEDTQDLKQLQIIASTNNWTDGQLYSLYGRRGTHTRLGYPRYADLISQIGQHQDVIDIWGFAINYDTHVRRMPVKRKISQQA